MPIKAYYNEIDQYCCAWLSNLMDAGHITPGVIDDRSIEDVRPDDLRAFDRCHFFAGIGVWDYALNVANWGDRPVWTGSCPCQPFSAAGKGAGFTDERHLWPAWFHLISQCRPGRVYGEQVASADGLAWLDLVQADLEGEDYASFAADLCAAGVGAPHIRQRLWIVADALHAGRAERRAGARIGSIARGGGAGVLGNTNQQRGRRNARAVPCAQAGPERGVWSVADGAESAGAAGILADTQSNGHERSGELCEQAGRDGAAHNGATERAGPTNGHWRAADWLLCKDGKWRPVEPGTQPLAHGAPTRVGRLRAYGNCISPQAAEAWVRATL